MHTVGYQDSAAFLYRGRDGSCSRKFCFFTSHITVLLLQKSPSVQKTNKETIGEVDECIAEHIVMCIHLGCIVGKFYLFIFCCNDDSFIHF